MRVWSFSPFQNSSQNICLSSKTSRVFLFKTFISTPQNTTHKTSVLLSQEHGQHDSSPGTLTWPVQGETQLTQRTDYYQGPVRDCGLLQELGTYFKNTPTLCSLTESRNGKNCQLKVFMMFVKLVKIRKYWLLLLLRLQGYQPSEQRSLFMYFLMLRRLNC